MGVVMVLETVCGGQTEAACVVQYEARGRGLSWCWKECVGDRQRRLDTVRGVINGLCDSQKVSKFIT
jgi:hypothetical protein